MLTNFYQYKQYYPETFSTIQCLIDKKGNIKNLNDTKKKCIVSSLFKDFSSSRDPHEYFNYSEFNDFLNHLHNIFNSDEPKAKQDAINFLYHKHSDLIDEICDAVRDYEREEDINVQISYGRYRSHSNDYDELDFNPSFFH
jgi:hypothetical protein